MALHRENGGKGWRLARMALLCWLVLPIAGTALAHTPEEKAFYLQSRIVLNLNPRDAVAGNAVGVWHLEYNELAQSRAAFEGVLSHHPREPIAAVGLALVLMATGANAEALTHLNAHGLQPATAPEGMRPFLSLVRARLLFHAGGAENLRLARALLEGTMAGAANPHDHHYWLGRITEAEGDLAGAAAHHEQAIAADPFWLQPYTRLAQIHRARGEHAQANKRLKDIVELNNPSPYPNNDISVMWRFVMRGAQ